MQQKYQYHKCYGIPPKRLLISPKVLDNLLSNMEINHPYVSLGYPGNSQIEILGLGVQVIPWMEGILVMP